MSANRERSLGDELRGARLGYRWMPGIESYVKIVDLPSGFRCHIVPPGAFPARMSVGKLEHRCWWENKALATDLNDHLRSVLLLPVGMVTIDFEDDGSVRGPA